MPQHGKNGGNGAHGPNGGNGGEIATTPAAELAAPKLPDTWDQAKVDAEVKRRVNAATKVESDDLDIDLE